ncbi:MAG: hypothetical protein EXR77_02455 [Myxococcales bacterium]|nr:hypothetical protein [Myxococcales bacterium]
MQLTIGLAFALVLWGSSVVAGSIAHAAACPNPSLPPGQEKAIVALSHGGPALAQLGLQAGDIAVLRHHFAVRWSGDGPRRFVYVISRADGSHTGPRAVVLQAQVVWPCWGHGAVAPELIRDLAEFVDVASAATATCPADLPQVDAVWFAALQAAETTVQWRCGTDLPTTGRMPRPTLGDQLRQVDELIRIGDAAAAETLLQHIIAGTRTASLDLGARLDFGLALQRLKRADLAQPVLTAALAQWQPAWDLALAATATAPSADLLMHTERAAAALVAVGKIDAAEATLHSCWSRFSDPTASKSCQALALADALETAGHPDTAQKWLDAQLARLPQPPVHWFAARIGLASRRDDPRSELATADAAVRAWPHDLALQDALATACFRGGQHLRAVRLLEGVFAKDPQFLGVLGRLSGVVNDWGRVDPPRQGRTSGWERLREEMQQRALQNPADVVAHFLYGVSLFYDAKFELALQQMRKVEPFAANEGRVFIYQAMAHLWLGHPEQAKELADKAVIANPRDPDVYYCQSQVLRATDKPAAALALQRYLNLEMAPGSLHFAKKTKRVEQELALLRQGKMPPLWDKPGHFDDEDEPDLATAATTTTGAGGGAGPPDRTGMWLLVAIGALVFIGGGTWLTRKQR